MGELVPLSTDETTLLATCEATIRSGLQTFVEVGHALLEIRDSRLYRQTHVTFEAYCEQEWQLSRRHAYELIDAAGVAEAMCAIGAQSSQPTSERQARELVGLPPEQAAEVMRTAAETGKVTAATIRHARETEEAQQAVTDFPDLAYYLDAGKTKDAVRLAVALRDYDEPERSMRLDNLRKSIAADQRTGPADNPGPDYYGIASRMYVAVNAAAQEIEKCGGAESIVAAMQNGIDPIEADTWQGTFADLARTCTALAKATRATLRSVK